MDILSNYLLIDLPEAFVFLMAGFAVFNHSVFKQWRKWIIFSVLFASLTTVSSLVELSYQPKIIFLFFGMNLLVYLFFRMSIWLTISICTSTFIFSITAEFFVILFFQALDISVEQLFNQPLLLCSAVWLYLLLLVLLTTVMRRFNFDMRTFIPNSKHNRFLALLLLVGGVEFLLILTLNTSFLIERNNQTYLYHFILSHLAIYQVSILVLFIVLIALFWKYLSIALSKVEVETEKPYLQNIQDLVTAIRSIKHDGINHYTAIAGFIKVERYDLAEDYVQQLLKEATDLVQVVEGIKNPAISALIHSKMAICVANHINFQLCINSSFQFEKMKSKDLAAVLGNLLDNAIQATVQMDSEDRYIRVEWNETEKEQLLLVENSGPSIPPEKLLHIFKLGYTTKRKGEGGVGLAVVKGIIDRYNGSITTFSANNVTKFQISIQK